MKPSPEAYPGFFQNYISLVPEDNLMNAFENQNKEIEEFFKSITEDKSQFAYASGKWTIKELLQHVIDTERVFAYRALVFARKDKVTLPGFEENDYATNSQGNARTWQNLCNEFDVLHKSTEFLFQNFNTEALEQIGNVSNYKITVAGIGFTLIGHFYHHKKIIEQRYF
jgi:uncharacterized damage-inducible protein DinB